MEDVRIKLAALWVAVMFTYLLGDVLRLYAGDVRPGEIGGKPMPPGIYLGIAALMEIPIVMVVLCVTLNQPVNRWVNIIVALIFLLFNLVGLPTYPGAYDKFLLVVSLVFNALTVWYAWKWV